MGWDGRAIFLRKNSPTHSLTPAGQEMRRKERTVHDGLMSACGADSGQGAVYAWQGNRDVGEGRMEIVEATPSSKVAIQLDFIKPLEGHNVAEFTLTPRGDATEVMWVMYGPTPFIGKVLGVFMNMDAMIGSDFETGLASLKVAAEK